MRLWWSAIGLAMLMSVAARGDFVPFVIPAAVNPQSLEAYPESAPIAPDSPRVGVRDAHFYLGDQRIKFWGVVLTFENCFPPHEQAEPLAQRLAQAGINMVRLHLMDFPIGNSAAIFDPGDPKRISADSLEKLDYLIDRFARHGIYVDVNLHTGRTYSKTIGLPAYLDFDKMTDIFMPQLIEGQKDYARQLLGHVSKYRHMRIADDPAAAIVEINNEDSLFMWNSHGSLASMPPPYDQVLREKFSDWLKDRYGTTDKVRRAWQRGAEPLGENMIAESGLKVVNRGGNDTWVLEQQPGQNVTLARSADGSAGRTEIGKADDTVWHVQIEQRHLRVRGGQFYSVQFKARSDSPRKLTYQVSQEHAPWSSLGWDATIDLTPQWRQFRAGFVATQSDDLTRLTFLAGASNVAFEIKDVRLSPGGQEGLSEGESLEARNIELFGAQPTESRTQDTYHFLAELEKGYWQGMYDFVKHEIGAKAMVTGTIVFGPLGLWEQSDMDFIDAHAYWQHPSFPGRSWDPEKWTIAQTAMVDDPAGATLFNLECSRLAGKPFTVSEYNHPAPADAQGECVPEIASFAAAQDWDMVLFHCYGDTPSVDHIRDFFDIADNPAKWGFMSAGAAIFRGGSIAPLGKSVIIPMSSQADPIAKPAREQIAHDLNIAAAVESVGSLDWSDLLAQRVYLTVGSDSPRSTRGEDGADRITWHAKDGQGVYQAIGNGAIVWVGRPNPSDPDPVVRLASPEFAAIVMTSMDGRSFDLTDKILIAACGRCENVGMEFSSDRHTVGRHWGEGPVRIQAVDAEIRLPAQMAQGRWKISKLDAQGRRIGEAAAVSGDHLRLDGADRTMWYLLERQ